MAKVVPQQWGVTALKVHTRETKQTVAHVALPRQRPTHNLQALSSPVAKSQRRVTAAVAAAAEASPSAAQEAPKASRPSTAEFARTIMELGEEGTISTLHRNDEVSPLGTYVAYALDSTGRPIISLPSHSLALEDLKSDNQCSLHVQVELPGMQKPQVTIVGRAAPPADASTAIKLELAWSRKFGEDAFPSEGEPPVLWHLSVDRILVAADVDQAPVWIPEDEYADADADSLKDVARKIVEDVNREHWQDLHRFCHAFAGIEDEVEEASIIWVDCLGFDLRVWLRSASGEVPVVRDVRIPFARVAADEREARSSITMMAQVAWEKERNYTPQMPSLIPTPVSDS